MGAMPSRAQSEFYKGLLPIELADEAPTVFTADLKNDRFATGQPSASEETSRPLARFLIPFCIGVTATLTWQSYSAAAKQIIARGNPGYPLIPGFQHVPRWQFSVKATPNAGAPGRGLAAGFGPRLPPRRGPLTGEHRPRISEPGRWSARPSLTRSD